MEELNFISAMALILEMIAVLVIIYKIENEEVSKKNKFKGFLLAIIVVFFTYYGDLTFGQMIPFFSSFFFIFNISLMVFILFNRFYENDIIVALIKTIITWLIIIICQTSLLPLIILLSIVLPYDLMLSIMNYLAQIWIIILMFKMYPRFRNRVNRMVLDFSDYPRYVLGISIYLLLNIAIVTYIKAFLIDNSFAFLLLILMSIVILVGLSFAIYKYFIKLKEDAFNDDLMEND